MPPPTTFYLIALGAAYVALMLLNEFVVLPALRAHFAADGVCGARRRQRKFEWALRQAVSYFYAIPSLQSLRHLPLSLGADFGPLVTCLQVGAFLLCALFAWLAWYRWEHAWES